MTRPVRIIAVFRKGKGHEQYPDGYVVHPEDRAVRDVSPIQYGNVDVPEECFRPEAVRRRVGNRMVSEATLAKKRKRK